VWASFPAEHKKRFYQGLGGYALLCAAVAAWIAANAGVTVKDWKSHTPSASASVKDVYLTLQAPVFDQGTVLNGRAYVSIIMSDMGLSAATTERALKELPREVALAFSPYADNLEVWFKKAADLKHETLIYMPMESASYPKDDPGPRALSSRLSDKDNNDNLNWVLGRSKAAIGVINFMGSRFLMDKKRLAPVFDALRKNGDIFIETMAAEKSEAPGIASQAGLPYLSVTLKIDADVDEAAIRRQLASLEKMALQRGYAIGIAEPYPITMNALKSWSATLGKQGITLPPLAAVWKNKTHDERTAAPEQAPK